LYLRVHPAGRQEEGTTAMTTPRGPGGRYDRDAYEPDADDRGGSPTWGRAPAGGWGAPAGSDRYGAGYDDEDDEYGVQYGADHDAADHDRYGAASWDAPRRNVEPRYGQRLDRELGGRYGRPDNGAGEYEDYEPAEYGAGRTRAADRGSRQTPSWARRPAGGTRRAGPGRGRPPWVPVGIGAAVVVAFLVLGFVTPGWFVTRVLSAEAVQTGVTKILNEAYETDGVTDVHCPERVEVVPDATFTCDATIDGDPVKVPVRVTDAKGGYQVGRPT
jgi:Domain of unknown function (DUF4333)